MLKMRLMAENEREKEGNFAPLIDASVKSEIFSLAFPPFLSLRFFLSVPLNQVIQSSISRFSTTFFALGLRPPFFGDSFFLHFEMQMFVLLPACLLYVPSRLVPLLSIVFGRYTACFRVCLFPT